VTGPFLVEGSSIRFDIDAPEASLLRQLPDLVERDDAGGRLSYVAHPDDPEADRRYQELVSSSLDDLRTADRAVYGTVLSGEAVGVDEVEAFMRVVGEARLVLASRIGIDHDGWEEDLDPRRDPEVALLSWLGYLQDAAVDVLSDRL